MKKYRVSLSVNVPHNFEIEIEAENEKEAYRRFCLLVQGGDRGHGGSQKDRRVSVSKCCGIENA